ncbi:hypothetical protein [Nocardioides bruguierae]|uniref:Uncharacterized protein n=1 Tax=Nocardioides bruguierae TaxID=2945102 RepID=A0A9X2D5D7_9ACTN|nr:hypothetical protein [Nocardioides bruguierae]MCM0619488.1 hypothetical protein [Nocardioides bruguierae]
MPLSRLRAALGLPSEARAVTDGCRDAAGEREQDEPACVALVRAHRACAQDALAEALGGQSLCHLARSGHPLPAAKFHEGAVTALGLVLREQRRRLAAPAEDTTLLVVVEQVRDAWWAEQAPLAARGPAWDAYATGGDEALKDLLEELAAGTGEPSR